MHEAQLSIRPFRETRPVIIPAVVRQEVTESRLSQRAIDEQCACECCTVSAKPYSPHRHYGVRDRGLGNQDQDWRSWRHVRFDGPASRIPRSRTYNGGLKRNLGSSRCTKSLVQLEMRCLIPKIHANIFPLSDLGCAMRWRS